MTEKLALLINVEDEALLNALISIAESDFMDYCNRDDVPAKADNLIVDMARVQYARLDSQGLSSQSIGGIVENFDEAFYNEAIINRLNNYRKLKAI